MAGGTLRRYDVQAKWAVLLSAVSVVGLLVVAFLLVRNYKPDMKAILFGNPLYQLFIMGGVALTMLFSGVGVILGINSAGQRRNEFQKRSWAGFFIGVSVLSLCIIAFAAFWMLRMSVKV